MLSHDALRDPTSTLSAADTTPFSGGRRAASRASSEAPIGASTMGLVRDLVSLPGVLPEHWQPPIEFDGLRILRALGRGGMGRVFLAEEVELGRLVAVKFVAHGAGSNRLDDDVLREARMLARLSHPGTAVVYRLTTAAGRPCIVYEYVAGASLEQATKPMPVARVLRIGEALASALDAVHRAGLVHRDVKPSNVMIGVDGSVKLIDFGLADRPVDHGSLRAGTPGYIAPETRASGRATPSSDVYSLGVVLSELVTGSRELAALEAVVARDIPTSRWAPSAELVELVRAARAGNERARPSATELAEGLRHVAERLHAASGAIVSAGPERARGTTSTRPRPAPVESEARAALVVRRADGAPRAARSTSPPALRSARMAGPRVLGSGPSDGVTSDGAWSETIVCGSTTILAAFPLVITSFGPNPFLNEVEEVDAWLGAWDERLIPLRERYVHVMDLRRAQRLPSAATRERVARWVRARERELRGHDLGRAHVTRSSMMRGILTAIWWIAPPSAFPTTVETDPRRALAWSIELLSRAGVPVPDACRAKVERQLGIERSA